jgi:hypothetical protein
MFLQGDVDRIQAPLYQELDTMGIRLKALEERLEALEEALKSPKASKPLKSVGSKGA